MEGKRHNHYHNGVGGEVGGRKQSPSMVRRHAASIETLDLSLFRGGTALQMSGSCAVLLTLHSLKRLRRSAPHLLVSNNV